MNEPELFYSYVRGQGWVVCNNIITMACGTVVRWERRLPKCDERSRGFYSSRDLEECLDMLKDRRFTDTAYGERLDTDGEYQYFTLTPV